MSFKYNVNKKFWIPLSIIDTIGSALFFWKKITPFPKKVKKILILRTDHIGDLLFTTPLFKLLKNKYHAKIHVLCIPEAKEVIEGSKNVDKIYELYTPWFSKSKFAGWGNFINKIKELRKEKYDLVIELHDDPRNIVLANLIGGYSIGYGCRGCRFLLNKPVRYWKEVLKQIMWRNLDVIEPLGISINNPEVEVILNNEANVCVKNWLRKNKIKKYTIIHPFTRREEKNWSIEKWAKLCDSINGTIILSGSGEDEIRLEQIANNSINTLNIFIFTDHPLKELYALIKNASLFIGTDTFATHLASIMGVKTVALYGPTLVDLWGPIGKNTTTIQGKYNNLPNGFKEGTIECMDAIRLEKVLGAIRDR